MSLTEKRGKIKSDRGGHVKSKLNFSVRAHVNLIKYQKLDIFVS